MGCCLPSHLATVPLGGGAVFASVHISRYADAPASCPTNACSVWAELHRFHRQKPRTNPLVLCSSRGKNAARIRLHSAGGLQADNTHFNASLARFAEADLLLKNYLVPLAPPNYSRLCKSWKNTILNYVCMGKKCVMSWGLNKYLFLQALSIFFLNLNCVWLCLILC